MTDKEMRREVVVTKMSCAMIRARASLGNIRLAQIESPSFGHTMMAISIAAGLIAQVTQIRNLSLQFTKGV